MSDGKVDTDNENNDEENDEKGSYQKQWLRNQHILIVRVFDLKTRDKFLLEKINFQIKMWRFFLIPGNLECDYRLRFSCL